MGSVKSGSAAGKTMLLLALLAGLLGVLGWNHQRNLALENADLRPYRSYSDPELAQLRDAYEGQVAALEKRYANASGRRSSSRDAQLIGEAVAEFQRVQQASRAVRELGAQLSQEQASLDEILEEQALRARIGTGFTAHLRRATRF